MKTIHKTEVMYQTKELEIMKTRLHTVLLQILKEELPVQVIKGLIAIPKEITTLLVTISQELIQGPLTILTVQVVMIADITDLQKADLQ